MNRFSGIAVGYLNKGIWHATPAWAAPNDTTSTSELLRPMFRGRIFPLRKSGTQEKKGKTSSMHTNPFSPDRI
jgi:hypothetical protein